MEQPGQILDLDDVKLLVDTFYTKVRADELLGPIFNERIEVHWPENLGRMYTFWETTLLGNHTYFGSPFPPHAKLPVTGEHFARWMKLFTETVDELFTGEKADEAKWRAGKMAEMFQLKINYFRNNPNAIQ